MLLILMLIGYIDTVSDRTTYDICFSGKKWGEHKLSSEIC